MPCCLDKKRPLPPTPFFFCLLKMILEYFEDISIIRERDAISMYALNIVKRREKHVQPLALQTPQLTSVTWQLALQSRLSFSDSPALVFTEYYLRWLSSYSSFSELKASGTYTANTNTAHFKWRQRCKERLEKRRKTIFHNKILFSFKKVFIQTMNYNTLFIKIRD